VVKIQSIKAARTETGSNKKFGLLLKFGTLCIHEFDTVYTDFKDYFVIFIALWRGFWRLSCLKINLETNSRTLQLSKLLP